MLLTISNQHTHGQIEGYCMFVNGFKFYFNINIANPLYTLNNMQFFNIDINNTTSKHFIVYRIKTDSYIVDNELFQRNINGETYNIITYDKVAENVFYTSGNIKFIINSTIKFYRNNILSFSCVLNNNKPHGEYIEYFNNVKILKTIMINGSYNGITTEYFTNGKLSFFGNYQNNVKHGHGTCYDENEIKIYSGNFSNNYKQGEGHEYYITGVKKYHGWFLNNKYHEEGTLYNENGDIIYEGEFFNGVYHGIGRKYENGKLIYEGEFYNGYYWGKGKLYNDKLDYIYYEGNFINGIFDGHGTKYIMINNHVYKTYEGPFKNGKSHGIGIEFRKEKMFKVEYYNGRLYNISIFNEDHSEFEDDQESDQSDYESD